MRLQSVSYKPIKIKKANINSNRIGNFKVTKDVNQNEWNWCQSLPVCFKIWFWLKTTYIMVPTSHMWSLTAWFLMCVCCSCFSRPLSRWMLGKARASCVSELASLYCSCSLLLLSVIWTSSEGITLPLPGVTESWSCQTSLTSAAGWLCKVCEVTQQRIRF